MQHELATAGKQRVARVVAALIAGHHGKMGRQQIDNLPFAFIAPLGAEHTHIHAATIL